MHGDFLAELKGGEGKLIGGLALLSGYINKVRREEENVLYFIAGDMVQGSLIDSEYKGISTMAIMNYLAPDAVALGNHEFDYGLPHLLFLEKVANFPIVNANLYVKGFNKRLMRPYVILKKAGFDILVTGIITEKVMDSIKGDSLIGSFVSARGGERRGREDNERLQERRHRPHYPAHPHRLRLGPGAGGYAEAGVGCRPDNRRPQPHRSSRSRGRGTAYSIAQAGVGTDQIGRFDVVVDDDTNSIVEYKWQLIPIDSSIAEPDRDLEKYIESFQEEVDHKYSSVLCRLDGRRIRTRAGSSRRASVTSSQTQWQR